MQQQQQVKTPEPRLPIAIYECEKDGKVARFLDVNEATEWCVKNASPMCIPRWHFSMVH